MSFILDALRKSEHDRQREKGPGLAEVAVAPPKPRKNVWASVVVGLLVVNLIVVGVLLLRRAGNSSSEAATADVAASNARASAQPAAPPASGATGYPGQTPVPTSAGVQSPPSQSAGGYPGSAAAPYTSRPVPRAVPPVLQPALPADDGGGTHNPLADELGSGAAGDDSYDTGSDDGYQEGAPYPTAPPGMNAPPTKRGSVVYQAQPEGEPVTSPPTASSASPTGGSVTTLPTLDDIEGQAGLPALNVELHVYSAKPQERFVFINSHRYKEGDTLQEGPHVDRITPDGAEMSYRGQRFVLPRQ